MVRWTRGTEAAAAKVYGVSIRMRYILWVVASCLIAGCASKSETLLIYRWDALEGEVTPGPGSLSIFGSERVAPSPYGDDVVDGISLNARSIVQATAEYVEQGEDVQFGVRYYDRQGDYGRPYGYGRGGDYFDRTFYYSSQGGWSR